MRYLTGSIKDWMNLFEQAARCTKPGGYVESYEATPYLTSDDGTVKVGSAMEQWGKFFIEGGKKIGRSFLVVDEGTQRAGMESAGLVNIQEKDFKVSLTFPWPKDLWELTAPQVPWGTWPKDPAMKELGRFASAAITEDIEGYILYMATKVLDWSREEVTVYGAKLRREMRNRSIHAYFKVKVVWGRKPEN